ncbi:helix-turn-helix domain-containing protein [Streptomyces sp. NPDC008139]|uniref:helix-turn-helix domain-containing protein n=1 Tax=Streptomyces sp. NPDC008139 TaxID=3364814 RepID=UPI0036EE520C
MYEERAAAVPGVTVWTRENGGGSYRVLPDGCMDLIWYDGGLLVAGPDTRAFVADDPPGGSYAGLRFAPGLGPLMLGVPARELRDRRVPLDALRPAARAGRLADRLADRLGGRDAAAVLDAWAVARLGAAGPVDPLPGGVARALAAGRPVGVIAAETGLGERQLRRRCEAAFGYGPKTLGRVLRLQGALELARRGTAFAEVAALAGYADQAHLSREVMSLAGVPLGRLIRPTAPA